MSSKKSSKAHVATLREYRDAQLAIEAALAYLTAPRTTDDYLWLPDGQARIVRHAYGKGA